MSWHHVWRTRHYWRLVIVQLFGDWMCTTAPRNGKRGRDTDDISCFILTPVLLSQQESVTSESNRKTRKTLFVVFNSYQSDRKSVKLIFFIYTRRPTLITPAERQKLPNYLCVMAASKLLDQLFLHCCNCKGLSSCVWHKAGLGRLTTDQKHKQDYRNLTFQSAHEWQHNSR